MKLKRFYYLASRRSGVMHRAASILTGTRTYCGIKIRASWLWRRDKRRLPVCRKCQRAR